MTIAPIYEHICFCSTPLIISLAPETAGTYSYTRCEASRDIYAKKHPLSEPDYQLMHSSNNEGARKPALAVPQQQAMTHEGEANSLASQKVCSHPQLT